MCVCVCVCVCVRREELKAGSNSTHPESDNGMRPGQGESVWRDSVYLCYVRSRVCEEGGRKGNRGSCCVHPV